MSNKFQVGDMLYDNEFETSSFGVVISTDDTESVSVIWFENPRVNLEVAEYSNKAYMEWLIKYKEVEEDYLI